MFKKIVWGVLLVGLVAILTFGAIQRTNAKIGTETGEYGGGQGGGRQGWGGGQGSNGNVVASEAHEPVAQNQPDTDTHGTPVDLSGVNPGDLSQEEIDGLLFMREEEKLARDVYLALYEVWGQPTFKNIAGSEQTHMDEVLDLLEGYGIADPAAQLQDGQFANSDLQALYDQLVEQGSQSLADALKVGAAIEEIDIRDLQERSAQTDEAAIRAVYENLEMGSENHLRAFTSTLARRTGETYQPQYLSGEEYQKIVSATNGDNGNRGGRRGGRP